MVGDKPTSVQASTQPTLQLHPSLASSNASAHCYKIYATVHTLVPRHAAVLTYHIYVAPRLEPLIPYLDALLAFLHRVLEKAHAHWMFMRERAVRRCMTLCPYSGRTHTEYDVVHKTRMGNGQTLLPLCMRTPPPSMALHVSSPEFRSPLPMRFGEGCQAAWRAGEHVRRPSCEAYMGKSRHQVVIVEYYNGVGEGYTGVGGLVDVKEDEDDAYVKRYQSSQMLGHTMK